MIKYFKIYFNQRKKKFIFIALSILITVSYVKFHLTTESILHPVDKSNYFLNLKVFQYIISNDVCTDDTFLLILIHSAPNHFHHRNLIRDSWGNPDSNSPTIKVAFLLASAPEFQDDIEKENNLHGDIVQGNFIDSYHNLTYKHAMGLKWAFENCANVKYLMKMDDDIFMDIFQFLDYIKKYFTPSKLSSSIACFVQSNMPVVRDPVSKWYVSKKEYTHEVFENYCSGWAYLTTIRVAYSLFRAVNMLDYFWVDDVHITGTAAKIANVSHIRINSLYDLESDGLVDWSNAPENSNWNKMFAPTWGDLVLSRKAYRKTLKCWVMKCNCCYIRKTTAHPTQPSTTRKGVAKPIYI